ncbi:MAG TPA: SDR family oxidoreductase [Acidimicrobiales bacterium]|nr:SDR family oxidoreductase [Acidimicrobiales bacterium]
MSGDVLERMGLAGRVIVVAGAGGGGIGTAICRMVAEAGGRVAAVDVDRDHLDAVEVALAGTAGPHRLLVADVRRPDEVEHAVASAEDLGPLHGLVHVVGGLASDRWGPVLSVDPAAFDQVLELNLRSALVTSRAVGARLVASGGGSIVHLSSIVGLSALPFGAAYAVAKSAMLALMRTEALEWAGFGVRVNAVAAGTIRTPASDSHRSGPPHADAERPAVPLGRRGEPEDVAGAVLFLLSDLAGWITGQVMVVDGGSSTRPSFLDQDDLPVFVADSSLRRRLAAPGTHLDSND